MLHYYMLSRNVRMLQDIGITSKALEMNYNGPTQRYIEMSVPSTIMWAIDESMHIVILR